MPAGRLRAAARGRGDAAAGPPPRRRRRAAAAAAWAAGALACGPPGAAGDLAQVGIQNEYYQVAGYFGSRVLEHNQTGRFSSYVEAIWSQHAAVDKAGRLWVVDWAFHQVLLMEPHDRYFAFPAYYKGYAGSRGLAGHFDGSRLQAKFDSPRGMALCEPPGKTLVLYISDTNNHVIRRIDFAAGRVSTLAGQVGLPGLRDGPVARAHFNSPMSLGVDSEGRHLFVLDNGRRIRHVELDGDLPQVLTLVDGACRGVEKWTIPGGIMLRRVGCHPDWLANQMNDPDVEVQPFETVCIGHQASCGPRNHPALSDRQAKQLLYKPVASD